jgi:hypothetical protein
MVDPLPGTFIRGSDLVFTVDAQDDIAVTRVAVAYFTDGMGGRIEDPVWHSAQLDPESGYWFSEKKDTHEFADGPVVLRIMAEDDSPRVSKRTVSPDLVYTVKNQPPRIDLQIPAWGDPHAPEDLELVTGGVMIGIATDLRGVKPGYPKIKFWPATDPEPEFWSDMTQPDPALWNNAPEGKTALEFRYDLRDPSGIPLTPGNYRFRFSVLDVEGQEALYPPAAPWYQVSVISAREIPTIEEFTTLPRADYHGGPFTLTARASHSMGISKAEITFKKDGGPETPLAKEIFGDPDSDQDSLWRRISSYKIIPGGDYVHTDVTDGDLTTEYTFEDGAYEFTLVVISMQGSTAIQRATVYIDTKAPDVGITRVQPAVGEMINAQAIAEYRVNGVIAADISVYDANNIGQDHEGDVPYRAIKYLLTSGDVPLASSGMPDPQVLYQDAHAQFFDRGDAGAAPGVDQVVYRNTSAAIFIDTTRLTDLTKYTLYIIARDHAGNYGYARSILAVDQSTDNPRIEFSSITPDLRDLDDLWANEGKANILDDTGKITGVLTDDDAVNTEEVLFRYWQKDAVDLEAEKQEIILPPDKLTISNDKKTLRFDIDKSLLGAHDDVYFFELEFSDDKSINNSFPEALIKPSAPGSTTGADRRRIYVAFDSTPPEITDLKLNGAALGLINFTDLSYSFTFTVRDANALDTDSTAGDPLAIHKGLRITRNGVPLSPGSAVPGMTTDIILVENHAVREWTLKVNETVQNSTYEYEISARDVIGKEAKKSFTVTVDTKAPDVQITRSPALVSANGRDNNVNGVIQFTAAAADDNGLRGVQWFVLGAADPAPAYGDPPPASGAGAAGVWTAAPYTDRVNTLTALANGAAYRLYIIAMDRAGNPGSVSQDFFVDQATDNPLVTLTNLSANAVISSGYTLRGILTDDDGIDEALAAIEFSSDNGTTWGTPGGTLSLTNIGAGMEYTLEYVMPSPIFAGIVPPDGPYQVRISAKDLQAEKLSLGAPGKLDITQEPRRTTLTTPVPFVIDTLKPVLTMDPSPSVSQTAPLIAGTVTEAHMGSLRISLDGGDFEDISYALLAPPDRYSWAKTVSNFDTADEGPHTLTVEALDKVGLNHTLQWVFYKDNAGPDVTFSNSNKDVDSIDVSLPEPEIQEKLAGVTGVIVDSDPKLRGSFVDEYSPVQIVESPDVNARRFEYRFDRDPSWHFSSIGDVKGVGKNVSWTLPLMGITEGPHMVQIRVQDILGNETETPWIGFKIDTLAPALINLVSTPASGVYNTVASGDVFTLTGTARDANIEEVSIALGGSPAAPVKTITTGFVQEDAYRKADWSFTVSKDPFDQLQQDGVIQDGLYKILVTALDTAGRSTAVEWEFTKDTTPPEAEFNNLAVSGSAEYPTLMLDANPRILGVVRDSNGVGALQSMLEMYNGSDWEPVTDLNATDMGASGQTVVNWSKNVGSNGGLGLGDGRYRITITARDNAKPLGNEFTSPPVEFRIDRLDPLVAIDADPLKPGAIKPFYNGGPAGNIIVSGTAWDANGVTGVHAWIDAGPGYTWVQADANSGDGFTNWEAAIPTAKDGTSLPQGAYTLNVEAADSAGRIKSTFREFTFDNEKPGAKIDQPLSLTRVNGELTVRGSANDNYGVEKIYYRMGKNDLTWRDSLLEMPSHASGWEGGLYSWTYRFTDINGYAGNSTATEVDPGNRVNGIPQAAAGTNVWLFPFNIRVLDKAGNETITDYYILVDPMMDVPQTNILSHRNGDLVGGEVRLSGIALDDDWIYGAEYRIDPTGAGNFIGSWLPAAIPSTGSQASWYALINSDGALNPTVVGEQRHVMIQVRTQDSKDFGVNGDLYGDPAVVTLYFDSQIPVIEHVMLDRQDGTPPSGYFSGIQVSKTFTVRAEIRDESGIAAIQWRGEGSSVYSPNILNNDLLVTPPVKKSPLNNNLEVGRKYLIITDDGTNWEYCGAPSGWGLNTTFIAVNTGGGAGGSGYALEADANQNFVYHLNIEVQSNASGSIYKDRTGYYSMNIQAIDNSQYAYQTQTSLNIQIDNFYPTGAYTAPYTLRGAYNIRGNARDFGLDSGSIQGLDHVTVYFSRNGSPISMKEQNVGILENGAADPWDYRTDYKPFRGKPQLVKDMMNNGSLVTINSFPADQWSGITIDKNNEVTGSLFDADGDGYVEAWYDDAGSPDKIWYAIFNSKQIRDGPVTLHYVIFDKAGNAGYYEKEFFIRNNAPKITALTLGTDIAGNGNIDTVRGVRRYAANFLDTGFTARNNRLQFTLEKDGGNGETFYRITHVTGSPIAASAISAGSVYTILTKGDTNWVGLGAESDAVGTTFVAASAGAGNGTATAYTQSGTDAAVVKSGIFNSGGGNSTADILYDRFTAIPDSNTAYFLIKAWDSTTPGRPEEEQLFDMTVVGLRVENEDLEAPAARLYDLNPHPRNLDRNIETTLEGANFNDGPGAIGSNMKHGGLFMTAAAGKKAISGHIEPRDGEGYPSIFLEKDGDVTISSGFIRDTVSGRVILRGYAEDNQRISGIQLAFDTENPLEIIEAGADGSLRPVSSVQAWVYDELTLDGHKAEWAYIWDTQTMPGTNSGMFGTVNVRAMAVDARVSDYNSSPYGLSPNASPEAARAANAVNNAVYNSIEMNAVPYIIEIGTSLSSYYNAQPSVFNRTAQGRYPVQEGETITVYGFNFGSGVPAVTINGTVANGVSAPVSGAGSRALYQAVTLRVDNDANGANDNTIKSGALVLFVNGLGAVNNSNNNKAAFAQLPNGVNNNTLTDDVGLDVWHFTPVYQSKSEVRYPTMKVGPGGEIGFSFANDYLWFNMPGYESGALKTPANFMSQTPYEMGWGGYSKNTFTFDDRGNTYGAALNIDESSGSNPPNSAGFSFFSRRPPVAPNSADSQNNYNGHLLNSARLETTTIPTGGGAYHMDIDRIHSPVMVSSMPNPAMDANDAANRTNIYLAYYDNTTKQIRFRAGTVGANRSVIAGSDIRASGGNPIFTANGHGLANGTQVYVRTTSSVNVNKTVPYYVVNSTSNNFRLSANPGGAAVNFGNAAWGVSVSGGGLVDRNGYLNVRHSQDSDQNRYQVVSSAGTFIPGKTVIARIEPSGAFGNTRAVTYPAAASAYGPGPHVALGVVKNNGNDVALLAWYDSLGRKLVFSYNTDPAGNTSASQWQNHAVVLDEGAGTDVSMAVDSDGGIHLAYYSNVGANLKYAYIPAYTQGNSAETVEVDSYLSVGTQTSITVGKNGAGRQVPYISYYSSAGSGTTMSVRYAYRTDFSGTGVPPGADESDRYTGKWEISVVPSAHVPLNYKINLGIYRDTAGFLKPIPGAPGGVTPLAGSGGTKANRTAFSPISLNNSTSVFGNGTLNAVIGYTTGAVLEMAQKK